jgi:hypothetical protein
MTDIIERRIDHENLIRELAQNKVDALEIVREALANAKDHLADKVWIRTTQIKERDRQRVDIFLINDGEGMSIEQLEAFWGVSVSIKPNDGRDSVGYKGHGTKLYFACDRLTVATCVEGDAWRMVTLENPGRWTPEQKLSLAALPSSSELGQEIARVGLAGSRGVAIHIQGCHFEDAPHRLFKRRTIESYCDWFTVIGDIRSGAFATREEFHDFVASPKRDGALVREHEAPLRPMTVHLLVNGEKTYTPLGMPQGKEDADLMRPWAEDRDRWIKAGKKGLVMFGHRFADEHEPKEKAKQVRDDRTAIRLVREDGFAKHEGFGVVMRVEGHRRQRETYIDATRQGSPKREYTPSERFGLWLCKDFVPVVHRNDLLSKAIERASEKLKSQSDLRPFANHRHWQVFVNHQKFRLTANRNDIAMDASREAEIIEIVAEHIAEAMKSDKFFDWLRGLQEAIERGERSKEVKEMERRVDRVREWFRDRKRREVDPARAVGLVPHEDSVSLTLPVPENEQEVFQLYSLLSARFVMPLRVIQYHTWCGIDAVTQVNQQEIFERAPALARVEFKHELQANRAIEHYFDAIDAFICWKVASTGPLPETGDVGAGTLQQRKKPRLPSGMDSHEVIYKNEKGDLRVLPVLTLMPLFPQEKKAR